MNSCNQQSIKSFMTEVTVALETIPLICSAKQWTGFCIIGTSVMKDSRRSSSLYTESLFLLVLKHNSLFYIWLFIHEYSRFTRQQVKKEAISIHPFYHSHPLHRHLDNGWVIAAESHRKPLAHALQNSLFLRLHWQAPLLGQCLKLG